MSSVYLDAIAGTTIIEDPEGKLCNSDGYFLLAGKLNYVEKSEYAKISSRRILLKFDVAANLPTEAQITSAKLTLRLLKIPKEVSNEETFFLHRVLADWGELDSQPEGARREPKSQGETGDGESDGEGQGIEAISGESTWLYRKYDTERWQCAGGDYSKEASAVTTVGSEESTVSCSSDAMVEDIKAWLQAPESNYGWIILGNETSPKTARGFANQRFPTTWMRPKLTIEYK